ncbi:hypothetical protein AD998_07685 [bacterium 336/3]|nr:hypothetical protein AD998_07685 [bacterium 336/3]
MDIMQVLSYGVIGLGFFLAFFSYKLLLEEQKRNEPRRSIIRSIYLFMVFSIVLLVLGVTNELWKNKFFTPSTTSSQESKYYLGTWNGKGLDIINGDKKDTNQEKYSYIITLEIKERNDSIIVNGTYNAKPENKYTSDIPTRVITGYAIKKDDFLRIIYTTKADPQPTGRGMGVFCLVFSTTGKSAEGYYISRSLKDGKFVVGSLEFNH